MGSGRFRESVVGDVSLLACNRSAGGSRTAWHSRPTCLLPGTATTEKWSRSPNLRDTLLPKLISGEMRLKDAEKLIGSAA